MGRAKPYWGFLVMGVAFWVGFLGFGLDRIWGVSELRFDRQVLRPELAGLRMPKKFVWR
jgi:hypothetical protein